VKRSWWFVLALWCLCLGPTGLPAGATIPKPAPDWSPAVAARGPIGPVTIGRVAPTGPSMCIGGYLWYQAFEEPANPVYRVPYAGVVTSVSHFANANSARIQAVFMMPSGTDLIHNIISRTAALTLSPNRLNTFPVRIPVQAGEILTLRTVDDNAIRCIAPGSTIDQTTAAPVSDAATTFGPPTVSTLHSFVNISAVVEPDVDGDGYGDASQDGCPTLAAVHDPCPAPVTTVGKAPKKRVSKPKVKIRFSSSVAGSTFACSVDGRAFKPCHSPFKGRFLLGTHTVRVQATSPVGVPGDPVTVQFKVVKQKR
jgi:hypothetical protein